VQARVTDHFGNPVPAAAVGWTVRSGGGRVTPGTSTADSLGIASATWTLGSRVDSVQVVEAAATVAIRTAFTATAALPLGSGVVKVSGDGQTAKPGTKLPLPLRVKVLLPGGQPAVGATVNWSVGAGSGTIAPLVSLTDANGEATAEWTLGAAPGAQSASASVAGAGTATFGATAASAYSLTWFAPAVNAVAADSIYVLVRGSSSDLVSATAMVESHTVSLRLTSGPEFSGWVPLAGLTPGSKELRVVARAANGDSAVATRTIIHDDPPSLTVGPLDGTVARPTLRVDADCTDDAGPCTVAVYLNGSGTPIASGTGGVHATLSVAAYEDGRIHTATVRATDSRGQRVEQIDAFFVEPSARWTEVATAPDGALWDFDATRLLYATDFGRLASFGQPPHDMELRLRDRASGSETVLGKAGRSFEFLYSDQRGYLYPGGAIYREFNGVYDFRGGTPQAVGCSRGLKVQGSWAVCDGIRRDLTTGTNVLFSNDSQSPDVAPNGDVVWNTTQSGYDIWRYRGGASQHLTDEDTAMSFGAVTDGIDVVFTRQSETGPFNSSLRQLILIAPDGSRVELAGKRAQYPVYAVNDGWTAFDLYDVAGIQQIWTRAPDGTLRQATHASYNATIAALGPNGELAYNSGGKRYVIVAPYTAAPVDIGAAWFEGGLRFRDGGLYQVLGRSAFQVSY
jgi:hypothetical protein